MSLKLYGLIGKNIDYSFSKKYFTEKFKENEVFGDCEYQNFDISSIEKIPEILKNNHNIKGLNILAQFYKVYKN